jgi:hypothetical protein
MQQETDFGIMEGRTVRFSKPDVQGSGAGYPGDSACGACGACGGFHAAMEVLQLLRLLWQSKLIAKSAPRVVALLLISAPGLWASVRAVLGFLRLGTKVKLLHAPGSKMGAIAQRCPSLQHYVPTPWMVSVFWLSASS